MRFFLLKKIKLYLISIAKYIFFEVYLIEVLPIIYYSKLYTFGYYVFCNDFELLKFCGYFFLYLHTVWRKFQLNIDNVNGFRSPFGSLSFLCYMHYCWDTIVDRAIFHKVKGFRMELQK